MAYVFGTDYTGCFVGMAIKGDYHSTGINGLTHADFLSSSGSRGYVITNVAYDYSIKYFVLPCFNKAATLYAFGRNWEKNMVSVSILALVGRSAQKGDNTPFLNMNNMMAGSNVMENPDPVSIYVRGRTVATGHLVGMTSSTSSVVNNVQEFNLALVLNNIQRS